MLKRRKSRTQYWKLLRRQWRESISANTRRDWRRAISFFIKVKSFYYWVFFTFFVIVIVFIYSIVEFLKFYRIEDLQKVSEINRNFGLIIAGLFAGGIGVYALLLNWRRTNVLTQQYETDRERLQNETYVRAIDQLGNRNSSTIRTAAIVSLGRQAVSDTRYLGEILEVLTSYVREAAPKPRISAKVRDEYRRKSMVLGASEETRGDPELKILPDIHAAMFEISRLSDLIIKHKISDTTNVNIRNCQLSGGIFRGYSLIFVNFSNSELRSTSMQNAILEKADFSGADLSDAKLGGAKCDEADFSDAILTKARFSGAELRGAIFKGAVIFHTQFDNADLSEAVFLHDSWLDDNSFRKTILGEIDFNGCSLRRASFQEAILKGTSFIHANLRFSDFSDASLRGADLTSTILRDADLTGADLTGAILTGADLSGATLTGAKFSNHPSRLGAQWDEKKPPLGLDAIVIQPSHEQMTAA